MIPAAFRLGNELVAALDDEASLIERYASETVVPFELIAVRKRIRILTADFKSALTTPVQVVSKPYSHWGGGA